MTDTTDRPAVPLTGAVRPTTGGGSFRSQLEPGADVVDPKHWTGSVPVAHGIAPRVRIGQSRWFNLLWLLPIGFVSRAGFSGGFEVTRRLLPPVAVGGSEDGAFWTAFLRSHKARGLSAWSWSVSDAHVGQEPRTSSRS